MSSWRALTLLVLVRRLIDDCGMLEAAQIKHPHTAVSTTADKDINAIGAESNIVHLLVVGDQLCFRCQCGNIPNGTGCVDA